jgi:hypothetical protein
MMSVMAQQVEFTCEDPLKSLVVLAKVKRNTPITWMELIQETRCCIKTKFQPINYTNPNIFFGVQKN